MSIPTTTEITELLSMLFSKNVVATEVDRELSTTWRALCVFVTPENEAVAVVGADVPAVVSTAAALVDVPIEGGQDTADDVEIDGESWDNFAEVGNVMTGLFCGTRFPRVLLHSATQVARQEWEELLESSLPAATVRIDMRDYPSGRLTFIDLTDVPAGSLPAIVRSVSPTNASAPVEVDRWRPYSFRESTGVSRDVMAAVQARAVDLANAMSSACMGLLQRQFRKKLLQFQYKTWGEYTANVSTPSLLISFQLEPLEGRFLLTWPAELAMALIDAMTGGTGAALPEPRMPSELDLLLLKDVYVRALGQVATLFAEVGEVTITDIRVDLDLGLVQGFSTKSEFLVMWMSTEIANREYQSTLALPMGAVHPLADAITERPEEMARENPAVRIRLLELPVELRAGYRPIFMRAGELAGLQVEDVIVIDSRRTAPVELICGSVKLATARRVQSGDQMLVQIDENMVTSDELLDQLSRTRAVTAGPELVASA